jgi:hypothetical protein
MLSMLTVFSRSPFRRFPIRQDLPTGIYRFILKRLASTLSTRLDTPGIAGPLWHPEWIRTFVQFLIRDREPMDKPTKNLVSKALHFAVDNYNSNFYQAKTLDMATLLMDILLNRFSFFLEDNSILKNHVAAILRLVTIWTG